MINIPIWVFILILATNGIVWIFIAGIIYFIFGILDLTYYERHPEEKNCPEKVEPKDNNDSPQKD